MSTGQGAIKALALDKKFRDREISRQARAQRLDCKQRKKSSKSTALALSPGPKKFAIAPLIFSSGAIAGSAYAVTPEDVVETFNKVEEFTGNVTSTVQSTYNAVSGALEQVYSFVKPFVDVAFPFVQKTSDVAIKAAAPVASNVASEAVKALENAGLDTKPVFEAGQTAISVAGQAAEQTSTLIEGAKPLVSITLNSLLKSDPLILAGEIGAAVLLYLLAPGILSTLGIAARGYKGDLTAPQALDFVSSSNYLLIDVRTEKEKSKSGTPSLPSGAKRNLIAIPIEEIPSKVRSQIRNARRVEAELAAIKISALKRVNKGTKLIILDATGNISQVVAKSLSSLGFKNTWTVVGGFDRGWVQNRLGSESYYSSFTEVLSPSRIIRPATSKFLNTVSSRGSTVVEVPSRRNGKLLPSGD